MYACAYNTFVYVLVEYGVVCVDVSVYLLCERCYFCEKLSLLIMNWAQHNTMSLYFTLAKHKRATQFSLVCRVFFCVCFFQLPLSLLLSFRSIPTMMIMINSNVITSQWISLNFLLPILCLVSFKCTLMTFLPDGPRNDFPLIFFLFSVKWLWSLYGNSVFTIFCWKLWSNCCFFSRLLFF